MSAFVVAAREVRERSLLLLVAVAFAPIPFLAAAFPAAKGDRLATIAVVGGFLAVFLAWGSAVLLGATTVGKALSENRLSFFFTKPLSPAAVWFGKAGASLALSLAAFAIAGGPALIAGRRELDRVWLGTPVILTIALAGTVALFFLAHALSTMTRSRSALLGADFVGAVVALVAAAFIVRPILFGGGLHLGAILILAIVLAFLLILAIAPVRQLSVGRTDPLRSHRALSVTLWTSVGVALVIAAAYALWVRSASPSDLTLLGQVQQSPRGESFLVSGRTPGRGDYDSAFVVDTATEEYRRIGSNWGTRYSGDGRVAAWFQPDGFRKPFRLFVARGSDVRATSIHLSRFPNFALSSDGRRIAAVSYGTIEVHDVDSGRLIAAVGGFDRRSEFVMAFEGPELLRIYEQPTMFRAENVLRLYRFDIAARKLTKTGERHIDEWVTWPLQLSPDGRTMLLHGDGVIADARTGATLQTLPVRGRRFDMVMLHDGSIAAVVTEGGRNFTVRVYGPDEQLRADIPVGEARAVRIVRETAGGKLLLDRLEGKRGDGRRSSLLIVDLRRGVIERTVSGFFAPFPITESTGALHDERFPVAGFSDDGKLALVDVRTGVKRPFKD